MKTSLAFTHRFGGFAWRYRRPGGLDQVPFPGPQERAGRAPRLRRSCLGYGAGWV